jgi:hypothetical protein
MFKRETGIDNMSPLKEKESKDTDGKKNGNENQKPEMDKAEKEKWDQQMKAVEDRLTMLHQQLIDIMLPEEEDAAKTFQEKNVAYEQKRLELQKIEGEKNIARVRWDEARNKIKAQSKQIKAARNDLNKIRKKLNLPLLPDPEDANSSYKVFDGLMTKEEQ